MAQSTELNELRKKVIESAEAFAALGGWSGNVDPVETLLERLPGPDGPGKGGFDAGVAACLGLVPAEHHQMLSRLHANYSREVIEAIQRDLTGGTNLGDSATVWWLSACSVCEEREVTETEFLEQVARFKNLTETSTGREEVAMAELAHMRENFEVTGGVAIAFIDGGAQGAYVDGHEIVICAYQDSHGKGCAVASWRELEELADVPWAVGEGPIHGTLQYVRVREQATIENVLEALGLPKAVGSNRFVVQALESVSPIETD